MNDLVAWLSSHLERWKATGGSGMSFMAATVLLVVPGSSSLQQQFRHTYVQPEGIKLKDSR